MVFDVLFMYCDKSGLSQVRELSKVFDREIEKDGSYFLNKRKLCDSTFTTKNMFSWPLVIF